MPFAAPELELQILVFSGMAAQRISKCKCGAIGFCWLAVSDCLVMSGGRYTDEGRFAMALGPSLDAGAFDGPMGSSHVVSGG